MRRRHSLRFRVAAAFAGLGALLSLLFALGIWLAAHDVSRRLMDETLTAELDDYMARRARNPYSLPPAATGLRGYVALAGDLAAGIPPEVHRLPPGRHEIALAGTPFRAAVADDAVTHDRYYILFDEERQRRREQRFLAWLVGGALLLALLAAAGAHWLAGRVISPVTDLAREVAEAAADAPPRLAADKPPDEIGELARAFDRYLARLAAFGERERAFAADASHELRTPLAVIRGAAEVLADDPALGAAQLRRVERIERAANEMSELTAALLLLAREEQAAVDEPCDCAEVVAACAERHRAAASRRGNRIEVSVEAPVLLDVAAAYFAMVVDNLIRNALAHTEDGEVAVHLHTDRLVVADTGSGIAGDDLERVFERHFRGPASAGAGIGLALVKRICDRHGWRIELYSRPAGGTTATLGFAA